MQKVKTFFRTFTRSLLPHYPYYHTLLETHISSSWRYFFQLLFFLYVILIAGILLRANPFRIAPHFLAMAADGLSNYSPSLHVSVNNGSLKTNYDRPYLMWGRSALFLVIDETARDSKIYEYGSYILATSRTIIIRDPFFSDRVYTLPFQLPHMEIDKNYATRLYSSLVSREGTLSFIIAFTYLAIIPLIIIGGAMPYLAFVTICTYIVFRYFTPHITLPKTVHIALHAVTLPLTINVFMWVFVSSPIPSLLFFMLLAVFVGGGVYETYFDHIQSRRLHHRASLHHAHAHTR